MTERSRTDKTRQDSNTVCECVDSDNCSTAERKKENETNNERRERTTENKTDKGKKSTDK